LWNVRVNKLRKSSARAGNRKRLLCNSAFNAAWNAFARHMIAIIIAAFRVEHSNAKTATGMWMSTFYNVVIATCTSASGAG